MNMQLLYCRLCICSQTKGQPKPPSAEEAYDFFTQVWEEEPVHVPTPRGTIPSIEQEPKR